MVKNNFQLNKRRKIIRDMYDGKIITDDEAVSKRNIDIIVEKEGLKENEKD